MVDRPVDADLAVIGAGPAGCAVAIASAARGLKVVLCERERGPRDRPGETLHPGVEPLLAQLGIADRLSEVVGARHDGIWIEWGGPRHFEAFGGDPDEPWRGFQVWRADFDALLLDRARALGVLIKEGCAVAGLLRTGDAVDGVMTSDGPVTARIVVDATGSSRLLGRALGVASPPRSPRLIARYGYVQGSYPPRDDAPLLVGNSSGWTWSARVRPRLYQWTSVRFGEGALGEMPDEFRGLAPYGPERGADVTWRIAERTSGPNWFTIGDAAAILDPTSSHGVLKALLSGMTAAHLIAAHVANRVPLAEIAAAYDNWLRSWFSTDAAKLTEFYARIGATNLAIGDK